MSRRVPAPGRSRKDIGVSRVRGAGRLGSARTEGMPALPGAATGIEKHRERHIPGGCRRGARGRRKREGGHHQILRGSDGHEEDHREKPGIPTIRQGEKGGVRELELDAALRATRLLHERRANTAKFSRRRKRTCQA